MWVFVLSVGLLCIGVGVVEVFEVILSVVVESRLVVSKECGVVRRVAKQLKTPKKTSKPFQSFDFSVLVPLEFKVQKYFEKMFI